MTEKKKSVMLAGLLAVAGAIYYFDKSDTIGTPRNWADAPYTALNVDSLALRLDKLDSSRRTQYKGSGRDLFTEAPVVSVVSHPKPVEAPYVSQGPQLPPPPVAPKLPSNVKFFGFGTVPYKRAFLTDGEGVIIVGEGDTLLGKYRVVRIGNANLDFEEISSGMRGSAPLEEQAAPPA